MLTGVGLLLEKSDQTQLVNVKKILSGGAAEGDGRIKLKDQVTHVDDKPVGNLSLEQVMCPFFLTRCHTCLLTWSPFPTQNRFASRSWN